MGEAKRKITPPSHQIKAQLRKEHKDTLFRFIFRDRKKLLQLYNALSGSDYEAIDFLTVTTLECQALVLNINYGSNQKLMENCRPLMEYSQFIYQIRQYIEKGASPACAGR